MNVDTEAPVEAPPTLTAEEVHAKMRQLRYAHLRIAEEIATCDASRKVLRDELEMIDEHQERVTKGDREFAAMLERELSAHLLNLRATDDRIKSVKTPWGDIESREQQPEFQRDEPVLLAWAIATGEYARVPKAAIEVNWQHLKAACHVRDGRLIDPFGEVVPGVSVIERPPSVTVRVAE